MMRTRPVSKPTARRIPRSWCIYPASAAMFVILFTTGGMSGGNCISIIPQPGGGGGDGPSGGPAILPTDHVIGNADASVTIVEYLDYQ